MNLEPNTPAGTRVKIMSSGKTGTTTGDQRDRSSGGMTRVAHEVKLDTGELRWATFCEIIPAPAENHGQCSTCGEDMGSQWATPKCSA